MKVTVVGAGISGLTCAFRLVQRGHDVTVLEAAPEVGGRMGTVVVDGLSIDTGANLLLANYQRLRALCGDLGMEDQLFDFSAGSGGILRDHQLTSFTPANAFDVLSYKGVNFAGRIALLAYFFKAHSWTGSLDFFDLSAGEDADEDRDAYSASAERFGTDVAEYLVDAFVRTFHFHGAHSISMKYFDALAALFMAGGGGFTTGGLRGYMGSLPRALAARVPTITSHPTHHVEGGINAVTVDGVHSDAVVLAVPAPVVGNILVNPTAAQDALVRATSYAPTCTVAFRVPLDVAQDFEGIWVPFKESNIISECSNESCKGSRTAHECVFTMGLHAETAQAWLTLPDEQLYRQVADEWSRLFPAYRNHLAGLHVQRWPWAMPVYAPGYIGRVRQFWKDGQGHNRVYLCGDYLNHPWIEGSIRCGEKVASLI